RREGGAGHGGSLVIDGGNGLGDRDDAADGDAFAWLVTRLSGPIAEDAFLEAELGELGAAERIERAGEAVDVGRGGGLVGHGAGEVDGEEADGVIGGRLTGLGRGLAVCGGAAAEVGVGGE